MTANTINGLKSLAHVNTTAAETVELATSRKDVRMHHKGRLNSFHEGTLKSKSAIHLLSALTFVGLACTIITAETLAVIRIASTDAGGIARARLVASLADTHVKELVGKRLADDVGDHVVNAELDCLLLLESSKVLLRGVTSVLVSGKSVGDEVLRDGGLVLYSGDLLVLGSSGILVLHEAEESKILKADITVLAGLCGGLLGGIGIRILKDGGKVSVEAVRVEGVNPTMRPAGSDIGAELGILEASIGGSVGRSRGGDVDVLGEVLLVPHGARVAGRHEEDESLEHLLGCHSIENLGEIRVIEVLISGHGNKTWATVIIVEDKDVILLSGLQDLAAATSGRLTRKSIDKVLDGSVLGDVILHNTLINIDIHTTLDVELVVDLTGERILSVVCNIILEESDDTIIRNTSTVSDLVSFAHGRLVTIVAPASATSNQNNPGLTTFSLTGLQSLFEHIMLLIGKNKSNKSQNTKE